MHFVILTKEVPVHYDMFAIIDYTVQNCNTYFFLQISSAKNDNIEYAIPVIQ